MTLLVVFNFYSARFQNISNYFISIFSLIIALNISIILVQFSLYDSFIFTKKGLFKLNLFIIAYLYARRLIFVSYLHNNYKNIYIAEGNNSLALAKLISDKIDQDSFWKYKGIYHLDEIYKILSNDTKIENNIVLINNLSCYTADEIKTIFLMKTNGIFVHTYADFCELYLSKIAIENIDDEWLILSKGFDNIFQNNYSRLKRVSDIVLSVVGLILSSPLTLLASIAIKLDSRGPVIFSQTRTGKNGKPFTIYKLRTMRQDAEKDGAKWASKNDNRITPVGNFLRKTRIDEIPQMYNVLRGDMSFTGPRPERPEFDEELAKQIPYYMLRYLIKPGLTGWAQVNYGYGASVEDAKMKLKYDLYYIKNYSFYLDMRIVLRTILIVLFRKGR
jgi:exopolysaccharide biosynthesis polyprenyl glycosylphosphotransferase